MSRRRQAQSDTHAFLFLSLTFSVLAPLKGRGGGKHTIGSLSSEQKGVSTNDLEKQHDPVEQTAPGAQIPDLPFTTCVTSSKSLNLSVPQFPHPLQMETRIIPVSLGVCED